MTLFPVSNVGKFVRDFLIMAASTVLLALANNAADFGVPAEYVAFVAPAALLLYRVLRDRTASGREASGGTDGGEG